MVRVILMLVTILGLLVAGHYALYESAVRATSLTHALARRILLAASLLLSLSFPAAIFLVRTREGAVTGWLYVLAAVWLGVFLNLLLAVGAGWLVVGVSRLLDRPLSPRWVLGVSAALGLLLAGYGFAAARFPVVHRVEVSLDDLPPQWEGRTIVQLSDVHLGHVYGRGFLERIAAQVAEVDPDLLVVTGDLFDGMGGDLASLASGLEALTARRGVLAVRGNHETYNKAPQVLELLRRSKLRLLEDEVVDVDGLQVVGVAYPGLHGPEGRERLERLRRRRSPGLPSVLLFHTPTGIAPPGSDRVEQHLSTYWFPDTSCALNRELGIDLQLSGHTHAGQIFPFGLLTRLIYAGRDRGLHRDGSFNLYVSSGTGTFGPPLRTAGRSEVVVLVLRRSGAASSEAPP